MRNEIGGTQHRRYVLGTATAAECEAIEHDYFERADVLEHVSAAEEELIDDYLSARLAQMEREQFERHYLASPKHRTRVAVVRALRAAASSDTSGTVQPRDTAIRTSARYARRVAGWLAVAASLALLVAAGISVLRTQSDDTIVVGTTPPAPPLASPPTTSPTLSAGEPSPEDSSRGISPEGRSVQPVVVAVTLSPILVRSASGQQAITIVKGTDIVRLRLRGQAGGRLARGQSVIRTVTGREVWRGPVRPTAATARGELARVDIPASALAPDDYIIELIEAGADGRDIERHKYFLRVQAP